MAENKTDELQCIAALEAAIEAQSLALLNHELEKGVGDIPVNYRNSDGKTLLHLNAEKGSVSINNRLIKANCPVNATDVNGNTALMIAIIHRNYNLVRHLIKHRTDLNIRNLKGKTALHYAMTSYSVNPVLRRVEAFINYMGYESYYYLLSLSFTREHDSAGEAENDDCEKRQILLDKLIEAGADVNIRDANGSSPLQYAVYTGYACLVDRLINAGAHINNQNNINATALHDAIVFGDEQIASLLLRRGANIHLQCRKGDTPLHWASKINKMQSHSSIIELLLNHPVDVNARNLTGRTPLHNLMDRIILNMSYYNEGVPAYVQRAIEMGANVNAIDIFGVTPLCVCLHNYSYLLSQPHVSLSDLGYKRNRSSAVRLLLESGADVNLRILEFTDNPYTTIVNEAIMLVERWKRFEASRDLIREIFEYVALVEVKTNLPVFDHFNLETIEKFRHFKEYYKVCKAELKRMKGARIENTNITPFALLTSSIDVSQSYVTNENVMKDLIGADYYSSIYPIYSWRLKTNYYYAAELHRRNRKALHILAVAFKYSLDSRLYKLILKCMSKEDVQTLIDSSSQYAIENLDVQD